MDVLITVIFPIVGLCEWFNNEWISTVKNIYCSVCAWKWPVELRRRAVGGVMT